jgi:hypothetical protein
MTETTAPRLDEDAYVARSSPPTDAAPQEVIPDGGEGAAPVLDEDNYVKEAVPTPAEVRL